MNVFLPLLMMAIVPGQAIEDRFPEAATVFHCTFDESWDANYDEWPDDWTRRRGSDYPHYISIKLAPDDSPRGDGCLRIDLNGGAAVAYSPPIPIDPHYAYVVEAQLNVAGLTRDWAYFSVALLDADRERIETYYSEKVRKTPGWRKFRLGPVSPKAADACMAIIGLHVQPEARPDLEGTVLCDDVWLGRLPRLDLFTTGADAFFEKDEPVEVYCSASGIADPQSRLRVVLQLEDVMGRELARVERPLNALAPTSEPETQPEPGDGTTAPSGSPQMVPVRFVAEPPPRADVTAIPPAAVGQTTWRPPIAGSGFYRVRATIESREGSVLGHELSLAVFDDPPARARGEFGWTLPRGDRPLPLPVLVRLIAQAGIRRVKYPLWSNPERGDEHIDELIAFVEELGRQRIELVGLLNEPPGEPREDDDLTPLPSAAETFTAEPETWYPLVEPVISRLAMRVRWWQLGDDRDTSFVDCPNLAGKLRLVEAELNRIGRDINLGMGWDWNEGQPPRTAHEEPPWRFLSLSTDPSPTPDELAAYLDAAPSAGPAAATQRWVVIEPLARSEHPIGARAADLAWRMIDAKVHGADAIFCPDPFSTERGLLDDDGSPGELLFTWRTVARNLGGAEYLGSIELPEGSPNHVFARDGQVVMVVWNSQPTDEVLYLGEDVRQTDLFGRAEQPSRQGHRQVIHAGPLPSFITGVNEPITRWRLNVEVAQRKIPSVSSLRSQNGVRITNTFDRDVAGRATLVTPTPWRVRPLVGEFELAANEQYEHAFEITLPHNADSGLQPVRVDFELETDQLVRFSVYRHIEVGMGDVSVEIQAGLNARGQLEVRQRLINASEDVVSFNCQLYAPERRRQQTQVIDLGQESTDHVFLLDNGRDLVGKTLWLRAVEIGGPRVLNYRFTPNP